MWVNKYLGKRWTQEQDCGYWFRRIQKEQFKRDVPLICNVPNESRRFMVQATRLVQKIKNEPEKFGWSKTLNPKDGDAALLAERAHEHHIGVVVFIDNQLYIVHAMEQCGVMISSMITLKRNLYRVVCYLKYGN